MSHDKEWYMRWKPPQKIKHGVPTQWGWVVLYPDNFILGKYTDIGYFTLIVAKHGVEIEDEVQVASNVSIYSDNSIDGTQGKVALRKGCKIGAHSVIFPGVTVGENAVVGAFSLVKEDIPANSTAYGIPAKVIKKF